MNRLSRLLLRGWMPAALALLLMVLSARVLVLRAADFDTRVVKDYTVDGRSEGIFATPVTLETGTGDGIGMYAGATGTWYLRPLATVDAPDFQLVFGGAWAAPVVGDWNGDGFDTIGVYDSSTGNWYLHNTNSAGTPDITVIGYGGTWALPVSGDWDGNGTDTIGLFVPSTGEWLLRNSDSYGTPDISFNYGGSWGYPVVGDWDGDGIDTAGIYNPMDGNWYLRNRHSTGGADRVIRAYGGWWGLPVVGDWNGNGVDTIGVFAYQTGQWLLRNSNTYGRPQIQFTYGGDWGTPIAGNWYGLDALFPATIAPEPTAVPAIKPTPLTLPQGSDASEQPSTPLPQD